MKNVWDDAKSRALVAGMTEEEVRAKIEQYLRRAKLLDAAARGELQLRRVKVTRKQMSWTVHAKTKTYFRFIAPARVEAAPATKRRARKAA